MRVGRFVFKNSQQKNPETNPFICLKVSLRICFEQTHLFLDTALGICSAELFQIWQLILLPDPGISGEDLIKK